MTGNSPAAPARVSLGRASGYQSADSVHFGRDWAGRLMACVNRGSHRGRKHIAAHGGTLRIER